jgi:poly-gamma-glutamate system protein
MALLLAAAALSAAVIALESRLVPYRRSSLYDTMTSAASLMESAGNAVRGRRLELGIAIDTAADPNSTGYIGVEYSGMTTSLGDLAAKRTTANPGMAALMVALLDEAGVEPGDRIAIGASGSFPAATIATLAAARAMGLEAALIVSLGSSSWGSNIPGYPYLAMHEAARPVLGYDILALSLGGDGDSGGGMDDEARARLLSAIDRSGLYAIDAAEDAGAVRRRMELYDNFANGKRYAAFVNIGGATANVGSGSGALTLEPGVNRPPSEAVSELPGAAFGMAARGVPVVNVLDIRALALEYGLPWDPVPFPRIGDSPVYLVRDERVYARNLLVLALAYALSLTLIGLLARRPSTRRSRQAAGDSLGGTDAVDRGRHDATRVAGTFAAREQPPER